MATQRIKLILKNETPPKWRACLSAIYEGGEVPPNVQERREKIKGFMVAVFRVGDITSAAIADFNDTPFIVQLTDLSAPAQEQFLYESAADDDGVRQLDEKGIFGGAINLTQQYPIEFGGRQWRAEIYPTQEFVAKTRHQTHG